MPRTESHENARLTARRVELSPPQAAALALIMAGKTYAEVARAVEVDVSTLFRWRREPAFAAELHEQVDALREGARTQLMGLVTTAVEALREVLQGTNESARVAAARTVLDRAGVPSDGVADEAFVSTELEHPRVVVVDEEITESVRGALREALGVLVFTSEQLNAELQRRRAAGDLP